MSIKSEMKKAQRAKKRYYEAQRKFAMSQETLPYIDDFGMKDDTPREAVHDIIFNSIEPDKFIDTIRESKPKKIA